jgi:hypothetical protein
MFTESGTILRASSVAWTDSTGSVHDGQGSSGKFAA